MSYLHLLVAVDFSDFSERVLRRAVDTAEHHHATLTLLHVVDYLPPLGFADDFSTLPVQTIDDGELLANARRTLGEFADRLGLSADITQLAVVGSPKAEIVRVAVERGADLIVIGAHGVHGLKRIIGSTASAVLNDASCDVLAVRIAG